MGYLILFGWLILLPICVGGIFNTKKNTLSLTGQWLWGQFLLWAVFQLTALPFILKQRSLSELISVYFVSSLVLGVIGIVGMLTMWKKGDNLPHKTQFLWIKEQKVPVAVFTILWLIQMIAMVFLAVNDGDDAYYMSVASVAENSDSMYLANVYAFGGTELTYRYALAPFPIWIAFLSRLSGLHTLTIGHIVLGIVLVTMSYVIYAEIGQELFSDNRRKRMQMLVFVAMLYIWGNTSSHTAESFLLLRSRQGKALVAGLVFPAMICLLMKIGHALEQKRSITWKDYLLAAAIILTGCLGSTLGGALIILLWSSAVLFLAIGYRKWSILPLGVLCTTPGIMIAVLYLWN